MEPQENNPNSAPELAILKGDQIFFNFVEDGGPKVEIHGNSGNEYKVLFINALTQELVYQANITSGAFCQSSVQYYIMWRIVIETNGEVVKDYTLDLRGKNVLITYESSALGDTIAWMPYVEEFRQKHGCNLLVSSFHNDLFSKIYPDIRFIERGVPITGVHVVYRLGWFGSGHASGRNPIHCHIVPLQKVATDILGLEYQEKRVLLEKDPRPSLLKGAKYVAITTCSTAQFKYYNRNSGWQETVDYLNSVGYKVVVIGKQFNYLKNVIDLSGPRPMPDIINIMQNCEFFVGLPSGLCWLAWAMNKKSVMITGISEAFCEYREDCYRVENKSVCHGCFNNPKNTFQKHDWMWCPDHQNTPRHFECTKSITSNMVKEVIEKLRKDVKFKNTHYSMTNDECDAYLKTI